MNRGIGKPIFLVLEGLDGAGKTSCAIELARQIGAEYMTTPSTGIRTLRQSILSSFDGSQAAAQLFYLSTVFAASHQVRTALQEGKSVVMDRYFLSTQVYAQFRGSPLALDFLADQLVPADATVYLDAPLSTRRSRLNGRDVSADDQETLTAEADSTLRQLYLQKSALPVVGLWQPVAATCLTIEQQAAHIVALIAGVPVSPLARRET